MKTKVLTTGILGILLVFSLIFTACPTEADDDDEGETTTPVNITLESGQTGLTLISAVQGNSSGVITVTLGGTITPAGDFVANFSPGGGGKVTGNYAYVNLDLGDAIDWAAIASNVVAVRQENEALRYYTKASEATDAAANLLGEEPTKPVFKDGGTGSGEPNIYIPAKPAKPLKWKAMDPGADKDDWRFIVSSTASPKTITVDITTWGTVNATASAPASGVPVATIIIDYSALTINP
jgi:hypothetical protein